MDSSCIHFDAKCKGHVPLDGDIRNVAPGEGAILKIEHFIRCKLFGWWPERRHAHH